MIHLGCQVDGTEEPHGFKESFILGVSGRLFAEWGVWARKLSGRDAL